jgi:DNA-binding response OmpR family regulator
MRTKLLIGDDEAPIVEMLEKMISRYDFDMRVAYDGSEAVSVARNFFVPIAS